MKYPFTCIRKRHQIIDSIINDLKDPITVARQAHKDRAELLKFADKLKSIADDIVNCSCITCGDRRECDFWNKYEALEKFESEEVGKDEVRILQQVRRSS